MPDSSMLRRDQHPRGRRIAPAYPSATCCESVEAALRDFGRDIGERQGHAVQSDSMCRSWPVRCHRQRVDDQSLAPPRNDAIQSRASTSVCELSGRSEWRSVVASRHALRGAPVDGGFSAWGRSPEEPSARPWNRPRSYLANSSCCRQPERRGVGSSYILTFVRDGRMHEREGCR